MTWLISVVVSPMMSFLILVVLSSVLTTAVYSITKYSNSPRSRSRSRWELIASTCSCDATFISLRGLIRKLVDRNVSIRVYCTVNSSIFLMMGVWTVVSSFLLLFCFGYLYLCVQFILVRLFSVRGYVFLGFIFTEFYHVHRLIHVP